MDIMLQDLPDDVLSNLCDHCDKIAGLRDDVTWGTIRDNELAKCKATFEKKPPRIRFEDDEGYTWFLLRWA